MITEIDVLVIISCLGFSALSLSVCGLRAVIKRQDELLSDALGQIREFVLASLAYKASAETHPMTGPAVLQQLGKLDNKTPLPAPETKPEAGRTGVSITQGINGG